MNISIIYVQPKNLGNGYYSSVILETWNKCAISTHHLWHRANEESRKIANL